MPAPAHQFANVGGNSAYDTVLKDFYEGPIRKHLNNKVTILQYIERSKRKWSGRQVLFPVHLRRNTGVGARSETGTLPEAGRQTYVESKIKTKHMYGRITLTGAVIAASKGDRGAFATALRTEIDGMRTDLRNDMNRQCFGNALGATGLGTLDFSTNRETGVLGTITAVNVGGVVGKATVTNPGTRFLKQGMQVVVGTKTEFDNGSGLLNVSVDTIHDPNTVTFSAEATANDAIARGDGSDSSYNNEITGLDLIVDSTGTLQEINPSVNGEWVAKKFDNPLGTGGTSRPLSLELMQLAVDAADEIGGTEPNLIMGHHSMRREYINLLTSDVRYAPEQLKGGFQKLTYAGGSTPIGIEFDKHAPYNKLFFIRTADLKLYVQQDWKWADRDGSTFSRLQNQDAWEAFMLWYGNLGCERRNSHVVITDLQASNLIF